MRAKVALEPEQPMKHIMKARIPLFLLTLAASMFLAACDSGPSQSMEQYRQRASKAEKQLGELQAKLGKERQENEVLQKEVAKQCQRADNAEMQLAKAREEVNEKQRENERLREKLKAAETGKQRYGLVLLFLGLSIVGFGGWLFFPRKASPPIAPVGRPKCPRCGWEHDPGDTICKNPACKTQF